MNKTKLLITPLLVAPLLASCNSVEEYKVSIPDTNGVIITPNKVAKGKDYIGTIKMAVDVDPDHLLPTALDKVTTGNKALKTTEYTYTPKEDKLSADFKIPAANIIGDVTVQLSLWPKEDPTVTEEEFNAAFELIGIEYVQLHQETVKSSTKLTNDYVVSPTIFYSRTNKAGSLTEEKYVYKMGPGYKKISRASEDTPWKDVNWEEATEEKDWMTPQKGGAMLKQYLDNDEVQFDPTKYNPNTRSYDLKGKKGDYTLKFINKKLIEYKMATSVLDTSLTVTVNYEKSTPKLPINPPNLK